MELVLTLPILGLLIMGLFQFTLLFIARGEVAEACRVGARMASLPGVTEEDVEEEVRRVLNPRLHRSLTVHTEVGQYSGDPVVVALELPMNVAAPDLLWPVGIRLADHNLYAQTRMVKE